jgi:hypothetical protein
MLQGFGPFVFVADAIIMNQKGCQTTKKNNQNWTNIYVLLFKAMEIMANCCFFIHMNVKEFKPKIHLM